MSPARTLDVARLATRLHVARCQSLWWSEDCRRSDGGRHAREVWRPAVRRALAMPDPAEAVHDMICDAHLDPCHSCPDRAQHVALVRQELGLARSREGA